jgi:hypothetical protein
MDFSKLSKPELLQKCNEYNIKCISGLNKSDLIEKIKEYERVQKLPQFLQELSQKITIDKERKVCDACYGVGHNFTSIYCLVHGKQNKIWLEHIKKYLLSKDGEDDKSNLELLSDKLNLSIELCTSLYRQIPKTELNERKINVRKWIQSKPCIHCHDCKTKIFISQTNTARTWKENQLCDECYIKSYEEREETWRLIQKKSNQCVICFRLKDHREKRFHYDHINMFDKGHTIYNMVTEGMPIDYIYKEIDKCQLLCFECHNLVTDLERKMGFMSKKISYTSEVLNLPENEALLLSLKQKYEEKMLPIYEELRQIIREERTCEV